MKAIRISEPGGPEVLKLSEIERPTPGAGEVLVRLEASGLNFIEIYQRKGQYQRPLPYTPGAEGAGVVEEVGEGVMDFKQGDRVASAGVGGSYAEYALVPATQLVPLPEGVSTELAAAVMLQGMTAHYLVHSTYELGEGETCLVHAAAGGVGLLLTQMAKRLGANVVGTVSTEEKAALAREAGADEVILYTKENFAEEVRRLTQGKGLEVVYDSVGASTFEKSLGCLGPRGMMVLYGQSSGPAPSFDPQVLNAKGALYLTRPSLAHYTRTRDELLWRAGDVLGWVASGELKVRVDSRFKLAEAAEAQRKLESRKTSGKVLLVP
jgi:NADPH:quinone reductase